MSIMKTQSSVLPVLVVGIVCMLALSAGPSCSLALSTRSLLQGGSDHGAQFKLLHWSHPDAPHFVPGLSFFERTKLAAEKSKERLALMSSRRRLSGAPAPSPACSTNFVSPLEYNAADGEYAMEITIGTPPQTFFVIADTGSDLVWVQCSPDCSLSGGACQPQSDPLFVTTNSSTYKPMTCTDPLCLNPADKAVCVGNSTCVSGYGYATGFTISELSFETITLSLATAAGTTTSVPNFAFGCGRNNTFPLAGLDGLAGLGRGPLSLTTQLGSLFGNKFSYCLVSIYDSNTTTSPLLFGEPAVPPTMYTPMLDNPNASYILGETFYYIGLKAIKVNGVELPVPAGTFDIQPDGSGGTILDSGTTYSAFTAAAYTPLLDKLTSLINYPLVPKNETGLDLCYNVTDVSSPAFPGLSFVFDGFELDLQVDNVFILVSLGASPLYCLGMQNLANIPENIIGNVQQQNFQILYDREAKRYGFAPVECDTL